MAKTATKKADKAKPAEKKPPAKKVRVIGNADHQNVTVGKAGRKRHMGVRPQTRGTAMNPVDHPHGGGEGRSSGGRHPTSPWGKREGSKTRKRKKQSNKLIVRGRKRGKATQ